MYDKKLDILYFLFNFTALRYVIYKNNYEKLWIKNTAYTTILYTHEIKKEIRG